MLFRFLCVSFSAALLPAVASQALPKVELRPETLQSFESYVSGRDGALQQKRIAGGNFLWADDSAERRARVRSGEVVIEPGRDKGAIDIKGGMIHDWIGSVFIPNTTLAKVAATVQNYDNHKNIYRPEVVDSRLVERNGNLFRIRLRLLKKKIITTVLNTDHEVTYFPLDARRLHSKSRTTRIAEVENPGAHEHELEPGDDHGLLWRLDTFWRFLERDGGVWVECEALSLTRGIPTGLGWLITPIVRDLPRESLTNTLEGTRRAARQF